MKDTFIIRTEWYASISKLNTREQAIIFKNLFEYHSGKPENVDLSTLSLQLVWSLIEPNLKRNIENYDRRCETSAQNGKLGGRPKLEKPNKPNNKPNKPIETLNDSDSDSDCVSDTDTESELKKDKKRGGKKKPVVEVLNFPFSSTAFKEAWAKWLAFKKSQYRFTYKSVLSEQAALDDLAELSNNDESAALKIINQSIRKTWKGFFELPASSQTPVVSLHDDSRYPKYDPYDPNNYYSDAEYHAAMEKLKKEKAS